MQLKFFVPIYLLFSNKQPETYFPLVPSSPTNFHTLGLINVCCAHVVVGVRNVLFSALREKDTSLIIATPLSQNAGRDFSIIFYLKSFLPSFEFLISMFLCFHLFFLYFLVLFIVDLLRHVLSAIYYNG